MRRMFASIALIALLGACTSVDETEFCVETRFGEVVKEQMEKGLRQTLFTTATCFDMTDQSFPEKGVEVVQAQTKNPVSLEVELQVIWRYNDGTIYDIFLDKRSEASVEREIEGAIRSGARNGIAQFDIDEVFSENRSGVEQAVHDAVQVQLGDRAHVVALFLRNIAAPASIEEARVTATRQEQNLQEQIIQAQIDSVKIATELRQARADAEKAELEIQAATISPDALELQLAREFARGLAGVCGSSVTTCIIGESVAARFLAGGN